MKIEFFDIVIVICLCFFLGSGTICFCNIANQVGKIEIEKQKTEQLKLQLQFYRH